MVVTFPREPGSNMSDVSCWLLRFVAVRVTEFRAERRDVLRPREFQVEGTGAGDAGGFCEAAGVPGIGHSGCPVTWARRSTLPPGVAS